MLCEVLLCYRISEISDEEYNEFYKSLTKDGTDPLAHVHFIAEGEVSFKSVLFIPSTQPNDSFNRYGTDTDNIKVSTLHFALKINVQCYESTMIHPAGMF